MEGETRFMITMIGGEAWVIIKNTVSGKIAKGFEEKRGKTSNHMIGVPMVMTGVLDP